MPTPSKDFSYIRNGMLQTTTPTGTRDNHRRALWNAVCDCGKHTVIAGRYITKQTSCGCRGIGYAARGDDPFVSLYALLRHKHRIRSSDPIITFDEYKQQATSLCAYCGAAPSNKYKSVFYQGIDRKDNSLGYISGNTAPCCKRCNAFKSDQPADDFIEHCKRVAMYNR